MESLMKLMVQKSLKEMRTPHMQSQSTTLSGSLANEACEDPGPSQPCVTLPGSSDGELEAEEDIGGLTSLVSLLIKAIKEPLKWEDPSTPLAKQKMIL